jgi:hypothetical protein
MTIVTIDNFHGLMTPTERGEHAEYAVSFLCAANPKVYIMYMMLGID